MKSFEEEVLERIDENGRNKELLFAATTFMRASAASKYSYNFSWLGRPIIQYPQDIMAMQELIWSIRPDLIVETGVAHGGSLIFSASLLELNAACGGPQDASVLGIDIEIRTHNRRAIEMHPLSRRISLIEGSSTAPEVISQVQNAAAQKTKILVCLDSLHTFQHVLAELEAFAPLVSPDSYCVVFDTIIEEMPAGTYPNRPWGPGNNPQTAVNHFLKNHDEFEIDEKMQSKLLITVAPNGYLKKRK